jgi:hypothetical protein
MPVAALAAASVVGSLIAADASSSAADTQAAAAGQATQSQKDMFNKTVGLEAPFRQSGVDAMTKLNYLLGVGSPNGQNGGTYTAAPGGETEAQIRARLTPQFTGTTYDGPMGFGNVVSAIQSGNTSFNNPTVDQTGLDAAVQAELAKQGSGQAPTPQQMGGDYGSLQKPFGMSDFQLDPGIQFQMQQGNLALQNSQSAKDGVLSGGALKDLMSFNQGMAGTGYQSAFDRYMANKNFTVGSLSDVANRGQAAAGNTVNAAPNFSSGIAGTIQGAGNASAAGQIGVANALSGGITGAASPYYLRDMIQQMKNTGSSANPYADNPGVITDAPIAINPSA